MSIATQITRLNNNIEAMKNTKQQIKDAVNNDFDIIANEQIENYDTLIENGLELYKQYIPPVETNQATDIQVTDAMKCNSNKLELFGNTEQASYDGKNLLKPEYFYPTTANGYNSIMKLVEEGDNYLTFTARPGNQSSYYIIFPCKPNTNYIYKCEKIILYNENDEIVSESGGWHSGNSKAFSSYTLQDTTSTAMGYTKYVSSKSGPLSGTNVSGKYVKFITAEDETECCISFQGDKANKIKIINPMLYEGTDTDIDYEPYVGGQPSPNPDYPQDIHVVTGDNTIGVTGKNLCKSYANGTYTTRYNVSLYIEADFEIGKKYALSFIDKSIGNMYYRNEYFMTNAQPYSITTNGQRQTYYFTCLDNDKTKGSVYNAGKGFVILKNSNTLSALPQFEDVQIEEVTSYDVPATDYEPYYHADYPINLGSIELCKIERNTTSSIQDYLFKEDSNWYEYKAIIKKTINNVTNWAIQSNSKQREKTRVFEHNFVDKAVGRVLSNNFKNKGVVLTTTDDEEYIGDGAGYGQRVYISIKKDRLVGYDDSMTDSQINQLFQTWLSNSNTLLYYIKATPTVTQITDETLIAQLDAIYEHLQLVKGTNNITVTPSDLKPYMKLSYKNYELTSNE